jgi:hypothetical protein
LRERYFGAALGIVNCNWTIATETFCCAGVEMLATGTPVFSFARGVLPESLGRTGGAVLAPRPDLDRAADLHNDPARLRAMGTAGRAPRACPNCTTRRGCSSASTRWPGPGASRCGSRARRIRPRASWACN